MRDTNSSWNSFLSFVTMTTPPSDDGPAITTIMMCLLFGTNALLYFMFQSIKSSSPRPSDELVPKDKKEKEKELSKPFQGTLDCYYNLTSELFRTGLVMLLTYICERHWIFDHSGKEYSRDLFLFVILLFFAYGFYTIKPVHDLTLLSREQTEEWKGWMQFIFLLYHYFHAEEAYNSVRVMITCYVWMTGFGNLQFFYMKQDFGWLRVAQMLWRLNFSVLLLMWTHGNTYILYYICPMHTFYFLMVYATMYVYSSLNHSKWGIRVKLFVVGILIYLIWDINGGLFDIVFGFLGTTSVIGATRGSVWEYYFRTSLDHWSSFLGMIFAVNFPLAEQYFYKANGAPLIVAAIGMAIVTIWWYFRYYSLEKMTYNLTHSYTAIIPLTSYIFFRNITPFIRSGVSMSMHDLGKTTLETYLLQHHVWLTSNAKTLLTIVPGHPWINFALATVLFFYASKELYRLTMSLRGMIMPDDKSIAWTNIKGMFLVIGIAYVIAGALHAVKASMMDVVVVCFAAFLVLLLLIQRVSKQTADQFGFKVWSGRAWIAAGLCFVVGCLLIGSIHLSEPKATAVSPTAALFSTFVKPPFQGDSPACQSSISKGHWVVSKCPEPPAPALNKAALCQSEQWVWDSNDASCPIAKLSTGKARSIFKGKKIVFAGDSMVRGVYHSFNALLDTNYRQNRTIAGNEMKHANMQFTSPLLPNTTVSFIWAPYLNNVTTVVRQLSPDASLLVTGAAAWDALNSHDIVQYTKNLNDLAEVLAKNTKTIKVWIQPTNIVNDKLQTPEKQKYLTEDTLNHYRVAFSISEASKAVSVVLDGTTASVTREDGSVDGIHFSNEVYGVVSQMVANAYSLRFPQYYAKSGPSVKQQTPKPTGSMSFPGYGAAILALSFVMLITMDSFLGIGFLSLKLFGRSADWEAAYAPYLKKLGRAESSPRTHSPGSSASATTGRGSGGGGGERKEDEESLLHSLEGGAEVVDLQSGNNH